MTETESRSPDSLRRRIRLRRFFLRHVPLGTAGLIVLLVLVIAGIYFAMSSARFENFVRARLVSQLEQSTGGRVEIAGFRWRLLRLEAEADGLVIHGLESPNEAPLLHVDRLIARLSILDLWSHSVRLRDLEIIRPTLHLIVYRDGSTNQPHPPAAAQNGNSLDAIFNMKAGHVRVEQGHSIVRAAPPASISRIATRRSALRPTMFLCCCVTWRRRQVILKPIAYRPAHPI